MSTFCVSSQRQESCLLNIDSIIWQMIDAQLVESNKILFIETLLLYNSRESMLKSEAKDLFNTKINKTCYNQRKSS